MRAVKISLLAAALMVSATGFSQNKGKEFFSNREIATNPYSKRTSADRNNDIRHGKDAPMPKQLSKKQQNIAAQSKHQKAMKQHLDSVVAQEEMKVVFSYDSKGNNTSQVHSYWMYVLWVEAYKADFAYNTDGRVTLQTNYSRSGLLTWTPEDKYEYTYDANGNETVYISYTWENNAWVKDEKEEYTYDAKGNTIEEIDYSWENNAWVPNWKYEYTYDANDDMTEHISYSWEDNAWIPNWKDEYTYDANRNQIMYIFYYWNESDDIWEEGNMSKYELTYDADNNVTIKIDYYWDSEEEDWIERVKDEYTYDANGNQIGNISYSWEDDDWVAGYKGEYAYDANGNPTMQAEYYWDDEENDWVGRYKTENTFDLSYSIADLILPWGYDEEIYNKPTKSIYYDWDGTDWVEGTMLVFYWSDHIVGIPTITNYELQVYPNPTTGQLRITNYELRENTVIEIFDIYGKNVTPLTSHSSPLILDISHLTNGMYFLKIDNKVVKIVKQ